MFRKKYDMKKAYAMYYIPPATFNRDAWKFRKSIKRMTISFGVIYDSLKKFADATSYAASEDKKFSLPEQRLWLGCFAVSVIIVAAVVLFR